MYQSMHGSMREAPHRTPDQDKRVLVGILVVPPPSTRLSECELPCSTRLDEPASRRKPNTDPAQTVARANTAQNLAVQGDSGGVGIRTHFEAQGSNLSSTARRASQSVVALVERRGALMAGTCKR